MTAALIVLQYWIGPGHMAALLIGALIMLPIMLLPLLFSKRLRRGKGPSWSELFGLGTGRPREPVITLSVARARR